ncbi:YunG family protein [Streptomyces inhibens]|uniref:YunG family protein n=1 Tax=Streptomyces inhibens TaxID=2293571 RepID=UPI001EE700CA|nr:hypothetical protein [Streptomyces inhibens]UKY48552.1 hypothetical protein KI385_06905 [Streptomyces inhibens]
MTPWNLIDLDRAFHASWAADTCSPDDRPLWHPGNPARGQCGITALVVHDLLGGDLVLGDAFAYGQPRGYHWWNRLSTGAELDLTREQFGPEETVSPGRVVPRPAGPPARYRAEYELLRDRVMHRLGSRAAAPWATGQDKTG